MSHLSVLGNKYSNQCSYPLICRCFRCPVLTQSCQSLMCPSGHLGGHDVDSVELAGASSMFCVLRQRTRFPISKLCGSPFCFDPVGCDRRHPLEASAYNTAILAPSFDVTCEPCLRAPQSCVASVPSNSWMNKDFTQQTLGSSCCHGDEDTATDNVGRFVRADSATQRRLGR